MDTAGGVVRKLDSTVVYENRWMTVTEDRVVRPDGSQGIFGVVHKPDFALVVPAENGGFHMVEEYRYPIKQRTWSFPQGALPDGQVAEPVEVARVELAQETGLRAADLLHLGSLTASHGTSGQCVNIFLATGLEQGEHDREVEEQDMRQAWFSRAEFRAMVEDGRVRDDSSVAAYGLMLMKGL